jgi:folylpolyglutamate synthase/dihydropteroate synthase
VIGDTPVSHASLGRRRRGSRLRRRLARPARGCAHLFEATATAFELFREAGVEAAVIEVGLGGRFDATNVIAPAADHDHRLICGSISATRWRRSPSRRPGSSSRG